MTSRKNMLLTGIVAAGLALSWGGGTVVSNAAHQQAKHRVTDKDIPNLGIVKTQIKAYYGDDGSQQVSPSSDYAKQMYRIERRTAHRIGHLIKNADASPVVLLDVDDTTLSTYNYEVTNDFGYNPTVNAAYIHDPGMGPTSGMPRLVNTFAKKGATIYYLTGRPETQRADTLRDLVKAGYPDAVSDHLYMRNKTAPPAYLPCEPTCTTIEYKSLTRAHIESLGYDIVLDMGDQFSDLEGGYTDATVKIPNPMYYIP